MECPSSENIIPALLFAPLPPTTRLVCLPAVAFAAYQWSLHLWNLLQMRGRSRLCLCVLSAFVCALTCPSPRPHAGVQTSTLERHLCNRAYVFRPFLLTVESQLPCGTRVCCSVMKVLLISALGCSVHASQLENADINTYCPVARSRVGTNLTHRSLCYWQLLTPGFLKCVLNYCTSTYYSAVAVSWQRGKNWW